LGFVLAKGTVAVASTPESVEDAACATVEEAADDAAGAEDMATEEIAEDATEDAAGAEAANRPSRRVHRTNESWIMVQEVSWCPEQLKFRVSLFIRHLQSKRTDASRENLEQ